MKKFRKIMAVLVAAMMIVAMAVPAFAAEPNEGSQTGLLKDKGGNITLKNAKIGETYNLYRLFELASFKDTEGKTGAHAAGTEQYSYVIKEGNSPSWYYFLTNYGPDGSTNGSNPYAVVMQSTDTETSALTKYPDAYFLIQPAAITVNDGTSDVSTYHVIKAGAKFNNATALDDTIIPPSLRTGTAAGTDADGTAVGTNYYGGSNAIVQMFAQEAVKYAKNNNLPTVNTPAPATTTEVSLLSNGLIGYYLVSSSMGTLAALDTTNTSINVYEKNDEPSIDKKVRLKTATEHSANNSDWVANTDGDIGDVVEFRTIITAQQGMYQYKMHDVMEPGLSFKNVTNGTSDYSVKIDLVHDGETYSIPASLTGETIDGVSNQDAENWSVALGNATNHEAFILSFGDMSYTVYGDNRKTLVGKTGNTEYTKIDVQDGDKFYVYYFAEITKKAAIWGSTEENDNTKLSAAVANDTSSLSQQVQYNGNGNQRNDNYAMLTYGNRQKTAGWASASVTTYQFDITKTDSSNALLNGATFQLYKVTELENSAGADFTIGTGANAKYYKKVTTPSDAMLFDANDMYLYAGDGASAGEGKVNTITNTSTVKTVKGIEAGTYILKETVAPVGYDILAYPIAITINGDDNNDGDASSEGNTEGTINKVQWNNLNDSAQSLDSQPAKAAALNEGKYVSGGVQVINTTGAELPSTGGMGTTVLYIVGGMLVILAGAYLFFSRKRTA